MNKLLLALTAIFALSGQAYAQLDDDYSSDYDYDYSFHEDYEYDQDFEESFYANTRSCVGTTPLWGATIEGRTIRFENNMDPSMNRTLLAKKVEISGKREVYKNKNGVPIAQITKASCGDGATTHKYAFKITVDVLGAQFHGCCERIQ